MSHLIEEAEEKLFSRQKEIISRLERFNQPIIFDVGGNIGQSIEQYLNIFPDAHITSFEPLPECDAESKKRFENLPNIKHEQIALAEKSGESIFHATRHRPASSLLKPDSVVTKKSTLKNYDFKEITVSVDTLDNYCARVNTTEIDILKIDVQGSEMSVLKGSTALLSKSAIRLIYSEMIFANNYDNQTDPIGLAAFLAEYDYVLWDISPFLFTRAGRMWTANAIFVSAQSCETLESFPDEFPH